MKKTAIILLFLSLGVLHAQRPNKSIPQAFCIEDEAYELYQAINAYRAKLALDAIPLSASLCRLASLHVADLSENFDVKTAWKHKCGMKSWSDKGPWKAFCYPKDQGRGRDIKDKAKELTPYKGKAWEILYWENDWAPADRVLQFWLEVELSADMLSNTGKYANKKWRSIGVAEQDGYVSVFLGTLKDVVPYVLRCGDNEMVMHDKNKPAPVVTPKAMPNVGVGQYYIIAASYNKESDAHKAVADYVRRGFDKAQVVSVSSAKFRVSLGAYSNMQEAQAALKKAQAKQADVWLLSL